MVKETKRQLKDQLDKELQNLHFSKQQEVLKRTHPITWKEKVFKLWNKEIDIPLLPVGIVFTVLLLTFGYQEFIPDDSSKTTVEDRVLVEVAGNTYWKDDLERAVLKHED